VTLSAKALDGYATVRRYIGSLPRKSSMRWIRRVSSILIGRLLFTVRGGAVPEGDPTRA
jgi:hypothetical protein